MSLSKVEGGSDLTATEAMFNLLTMKAESDAKTSCELVAASNAQVTEQRKFHEDVMDLFKKQAEQIEALQKQNAALEKDKVTTASANAKKDDEMTTLFEKMREEMQTMRDGLTFLRGENLSVKKRLKVFEDAFANHIHGETPIRRLNTCAGCLADGAKPVIHLGGTVQKPMGYPYNPACTYTAYNTKPYEPQFQEEQKQEQKQDNILEENQRLKKTVKRMENGLGKIQKSIDASLDIISQAQQRS